MKNYYQLLGVSERASEQEIQLAYSAMYQKYNSGSNLSSNKEEQLIDIVVAFNALTNSKIKKEYDKVLKENADKVEAMQPLPVRPVKSIKRSMFLSGGLIAVLVVSFAFTVYLLSKYVQERSELSAMRKANTRELISIPQTNAVQETTMAVEHTNATLMAKTIKPVTAILKEEAIKPEHTTYAVAKRSHMQQLPATTAKDEAKEYAVKNKWEKGEVLKVKGTPNAIVRYDKENEVWCYNTGNISFNNGQTSTAPQN